MTINNKFNFGEIVYYKTDKDQSENMIVGLMVKCDNILYETRKGYESEHWAYEFELSNEIDTLKKVL